MTQVASKRQALSPKTFWNLFLHLISFRQSMPVTELMLFPDETTYYVCPRCDITLEREFMPFCDRCGQCLNWKDYKKAKIVYPGPRDSLHS